ncbi:hypothetical protein JCM6882_000434 [Rhodosporidiobolus microsporus]
MATGPGVDFPAQKATFATLQAWKVAVYRAGYSHGVDLHLEHGSDGRWLFRCAATRSGGNGATYSCPFVVAAEKRPPGSSGVRVTKSYLRHCCGASERQTHAQLAKTTCAKALAELGYAPPASAAPVSSTAFTPSPAPSSSRQAGAITTGAEDVSSSDEESSAPQSKPFPSSKSLKSDVEALVQCGFVSLPSFEATFPTSRALLVRLHAYASSRRFKLFRRGASNTPDLTHLLCSKAKGVEACKFVVKIKKGDDGLWRIAKVHAEHSHELEGAALCPSTSIKQEEHKSTAEPSKPSSSKRRTPPLSASPSSKRPRLASSSDAASLPPSALSHPPSAPLSSAAPSLAASPSITSHSAPALAPPPSEPFTTAAPPPFRPSSQQVLRPPAWTSAPPDSSLASPFAPSPTLSRHEISSFFLSLDPAFTSECSSSLADKLTDSGVTSLGDLAAFLCFEAESTRWLVELLAAGGGAASSSSSRG